MQIAYTKGHSPSLDGLRGIAILLVLMYHFFNFSPLHTYTISGWMGVDLFFVLSGFLITGILYDSKGSKNYYRNFIVRRILRIFPLYYLVIIVCFALVATGVSTQPILVYHNQIYFWTYTENLFFAFKGWPPGNSAEPGMLNHFWSLAIEEQFYLFWPLLVLKLNKKILFSLALVLIALAILLRNLYTTNPFYYVFTFCRLDALLLGSLTAILVRENVQFIRKIIPFLFTGCLVVLFVIVVTTRDLSLENILFVRVGYTVLDASFACLLVFAFSPDIIGKILQSVLNLRVLRFFGKYSYGIYVYHFILFTLLQVKLASLFAYSPAVKNFLSGLVLLLITVFLSVLSYHFFEKYFLRLKKKFQTIDS